MEDPLQDADLRRKMSANLDEGAPPRERARHPGVRPHRAPSRLALWIWIALLLVAFVGLLTVLT